MEKIFDLSGKEALVTGGGSGIGKAISLALAGNGAHVYLVERNLEAGQKVAEEILQADGKCTVLEADVSDEASVAAAFAQVGDSLDILVNNAGIAQVGKLSDTTAEGFGQIVDVNVKGVFYCLKAGTKLMEAKGGAIINMSSIAAHVGINDRFAYSMSKGAVHAMTLSVAKDYLDQNIRCNSISPARIHTPFVDGFISKNYPGKEQEMFDKLSKTQPIGRMGSPEEVGNLVLYLSSDEASFITGTDFPIDGGFITLNG